MSGGANVAVTVRGSAIVTEHEPVPVHAPVQPENDQPGVGVAVSVTVLSVANCAVQVRAAVDPARLARNLAAPVDGDRERELRRAHADERRVDLVRLPGLDRVDRARVPPQRFQPSKAEPGLAVALSVTGL